MLLLLCTIDTSIHGKAVGIMMVKRLSGVVTPLFLGRNHLQVPGSTIVQQQAISSKQICTQVTSSGRDDAVCWVRVHLPGQTGAGDGNFRGERRQADAGQRQRGPYPLANVLLEGKPAFVDQNSDFPGRNRGHMERACVCSALN